MFRRTFRHAAAAALALTVVAGSAHAQRTFTSLTMFGDSFSDVGNARAIFGAGVPARFSNGPVWSDVLGGRLGRTSDVVPIFPLPVPPTLPRATGVYAVGGALAVGGAVPSTQQQFGLWCGLAITPSGCTRGADATGLYTLFVGGNDVRGAATLGTDAARRAATVAAANAVVAQGGQLTGLGARSILFAYLPDLGLTPDRLGGPLSGVLTELTALFNSTLETGIAGLRAAAPMGTSLYDLRLDNLFTNIIGAPGSYGFTNTTQACTTAGALPNCTGFVFFDGLHPTTAAHALVGEAAYQLVAFDRNVAVIPEPSTYALLGAGLLGVGGLAARRRRAA